MGREPLQPITDDKFEYCTIDFMTDLPEVNGYNALMVIVSIVHDKPDHLAVHALCCPLEGSL